MICEKKTWICLSVLLYLFTGFNSAFAGDTLIFKSVFPRDPTPFKTSKPAVGDPEYQLGAEDILLISVWEDERLAREVLVRPDGMISFPLIGTIKASGMTTEALQAEIVHLLSRFMPDPSVLVAVKQINSYKIYVIGKVNRAGMFALGHRIDVLQALSLAGGLAPFASANNIKILRREKGVQESHAFRYGEVIKGEKLEQNMMLSRGDIVVVP